MFLKDMFHKLQCAICALMLKGQCLTAIQQGVRTGMQTHPDPRCRAAKAIGLLAYCAAHPVRRSTCVRWVHATFPTGHGIAATDAIRQVPAPTCRWARSGAS